MKLKFSDRFLKNTQMSNFMKMCPLGEELFCADEQAGVTKLIIDFCGIANVLKNC